MGSSIFPFLSIKEKGENNGYFVIRIEFDKFFENSKILMNVSDWKIKNFKCGLRYKRQKNERYIIDVH